MSKVFEVKDFVSGTRGRVRLEPLPGYAPDLNPWDEGAWHHLKNVEMRNLVCRDLVVRFTISGRVTDSRRWPLCWELRR
jgi:hypothetical protein